MRDPDSDRELRRVPPRLRACCSSWASLKTKVTIRTSAHLGNVPATFNERSGGNRIVDHGRYRSFRSICAITVK